MDPAPWTVTISDDEPSLSELLHDRIYEFNVEATGLDDGRLLAITIRGAHGDVIGGLSGWTWGGCGYVDVIWVAAAYRGQGLGTTLMEAAEMAASSRGCTRMALSTHSFQAPDFYRRRGYVETGRTPDYPQGFSQLHLSKELRQG